MTDNNHDNENGGNDQSGSEGIIGTTMNNKATLANSIGWNTC